MKVSALSLLIAALPALLSASPIAVRDNDSQNGYTLREVGSRNTEDWRIWLEKDGNPISFWHDVPLYPDPKNTSIVHMVVEIPRWTSGKIETNREEPLNPIFHDTRNDKPRFVENVWPHKSYPFLYGSLPQTWESPNFEHEFTGLEGDNDPMDLFDIGQDPGYIGQIKTVKVLGGLAVNDGNETDWKMMTIDVADPLAPFVNSVADVEKYRPGLAEACREWWTIYKVARGDDVIPIIGETYQNTSYSEYTIGTSHRYWKDLIADKVDRNEININQTYTSTLNSYIGSSGATKKVDIPSKSAVMPAAAIPAVYQEWRYIQDGKLVAGPGNGNGEEE